MNHYKQYAQNETLMKEGPRIERSKRTLKPETLKRINPKENRPTPKP